MHTHANSYLDVLNWHIMLRYGIYGIDYQVIFCKSANGSAKNAILSFYLI